MTEQMIARYEAVATKCLRRGGHWTHLGLELQGIALHEFGCLLGTERRTSPLALAPGDVPRFVEYRVRSTFCE